MPLDERMRRAGFTPRELGLLKESHARSDVLVHLEEQAFAAMEGKGQGTLRPDPSQAQGLLYGEAYHRAKASIMTPINEFLESIDSRTTLASKEAQLRATRQFSLTVALLALVAALALSLAVQEYRLGSAIVLTLEQEVAARTDLLTRANGELTASKGELERTLSEVRTLQGLLPICSWCKKIRDEAGLWTQMEAYMAEHSDAAFTHGICPDCRQAFGHERDTHA